jgi:hypothetical protein
MATPIVEDSFGLCYDQPSLSCRSYGLIGHICRGGAPPSIRQINRPLSKILAGDISVSQANVLASIGMVDPAV